MARLPSILQFPADFALECSLLLLAMAVMLRWFTRSVNACTNEPKPSAGHKAYSSCL